MIQKSIKLANEAIHIRHANFLVKLIADNDNTTCIEDKLQEI